MNISLFLDEDVHSQLAQALRRRGYDVVHAQELDRKGRSDNEQLQFAVRERRCFLTFNVRDFTLLHNEYAQHSQEHFGIIVSKQLSFRETLSRLLNFLRLASEDTVRNRIQFL
jgi:predicted nuclease of predicted toxin-antitoxin system